MPKFCSVLAACNALIVFVGLILFSTQVAGDDEYYDTLSSLNLEHTFDSGLNPVYSRRGVISIHSITSNNADIDQEDSHTPQDITKLKALVKSNGMYRVRIMSRPATASSPAQYVQSFTPACGLYESSLSDHIEIHLDASGNLIGMSIDSISPHCTGIQPPSRQMQEFNSTVDLIQTTSGPFPETSTYVQKIEQERQEKMKGGQVDNRSFIAKYWMYIVPLVIIMMFANTADPNQGGGGR
ncbi:hypothetical protein CAPTEDRAFT_149354 [Capitella teleta]|uniref:ER membrane protein complex subunit 10 n=1 Tax=Capitella teleta TaxID=283909 RepID=R7TVV6_CAPTE|nr:hypothetical protein CAPTEDRAFT_149354 [Capitella teleta]|eukprot:ELT97722.1 hypothetical protein CAPTEDRAFT_149354 [Capitella teleta]